MAPYRIPQIEDYEPFIGIENVERIREKARKLKGLRVANFNSTYYGGGVAETISSLTLLMNSLGLRTEWRVIQGTADFFSITKKMHNALQSGGIDLSSKKEIFEQVIYENSVRNFLDRDFVIARSAAAALNGFLVSSVEDPAERIVQLINNKKLRNEMGRKVREKFLLTRYLEQHLDLFGAL